MGLETATNISTLNSLWPLDSDAIGAGDDHIRMLKSVLKATFPGAAGAGFSTPITVDESQMNLLVPCVDNITALKAQLKTGQTALYTKGYYAVGDGGGGFYWYDSTDTTSADNGGSIIVATDGGRWKLNSVNGVINVKQWGAKGDGATNDSARVQAAVDYASLLIVSASSLDSFSLEIYFPYGKYLFGATVTVADHGIGFSGPTGRGAMIIGDVLLFDIGDYTYATRSRAVTFDWLLLASTNTGNTTAAIKLFRTVAFKFQNGIIANFDIAIDSYRSSTSRFLNMDVINSSRTVNATAFMRFQGVDETASTAETYTPGGGVHITDCEFSGARTSGGTEVNYNESGLLFKGCDGAYVQNTHFTGCRYTIDIYPDATPANHIITELIFDTVYLDNPSVLASAPRHVHMRGSVKSGIVMADATTRNSVYQGIKFNNVFLRGAAEVDYCVYMSVTDGNTFVADGRKISDLEFQGGAIAGAAITGIRIAGSSSAAVEPYGVIINGINFKDHNTGGTATFSCINIEVESCVVNNNIIQADTVAATRPIQLSITALPSNLPSAVAVGNNCAGSNCTSFEAITVSTVTGANVLIAKNIFPGKGKQVSNTYKVQTTDGAPYVLWSLGVLSTGQAGIVNVRTIAANDTASENAMYEHRTAFSRVSAGSTALSGLAIVQSSDTISGNNAPAVLSLLTGAAFPLSTAVTAGTLYTNAGHVYLVLVSGTTGGTAPVFTSGTAVSGTATIGHVATTAANTLALIVSGTAATTISWLADVELISVT